jgi:hypothetical protein
MFGSPLPYPTATGLSRLPAVLEMEEGVLPAPPPGFNLESFAQLLVDLHVMSLLPELPTGCMASTRTREG